MLKIIMISVLFIASPAHAYLGPGMAGGAVVAIFAIIAALLISLWGIIYYPMKRKFKGVIKKTENMESEKEK